MTTARESGTLRTRRRSDGSGSAHLMADISPSQESGLFLPPFSPLRATTVDVSRWRQFWPWLRKCGRCGVVAGCCSRGPAGQKVSRKRRVSNMRLDSWIDVPHIGGGSAGLPAKHATQPSPKFPVMDWMGLVASFISHSLAQIACQRMHLAVLTIGNHWKLRHLTWTATMGRSVGCAMSGMLRLATAGWQARAHCTQHIDSWTGHLNVEDERRNLQNVVWQPRVPDRCVPELASRFRERDPCLPTCFLPRVTAVCLAPSCRRFGHGRQWHSEALVWATEPPLHPCARF